MDTDATDFHESKKRLFAPLCGYLCVIPDTMVISVIHNSYIFRPEFKFRLQCLSAIREFNLRKLTQNCEVLNLYLVANAGKVLAKSGGKYYNCRIFRVPGICTFVYIIILRMSYG